MMANTKPSAVTKWRKRRQREGFVRVELQVKKEDVALVRDVTKALMDPVSETEARALLRKEFAARPKVGLKTLLFSAPLEGIDLVRLRDFGREIDL